MVNTLYIATAGTVSIDLRDTGFITQIVITTSNAANGGAEVSFNSTASLTTSDTTGVIAGLVLTSGLAQSQAFAMREPVDVGERLFLHVTGASNLVRVMVITESAGAAPRATVRRR